MLFNYQSLLIGVSLISQALSAPLLESRAVAAITAFPDLHRAAKLSSAAYTGCIGKAFDVTITKRIYDLLTDTNGFVGYSTEKKKISVIMRGSTTIADFINDIDISLINPKLSGVTFPADVKIMRGIHRPWSAVHDTIIAEVKSLVEKYPGYSLEAVGHSLGGALTYIAHVALAQNFPGKELTSNALNTFPIGNEAWATFATSQPGTLNRGNNYLDGVPNMYSSSLVNFKHYGTVSYPNEALSYKFSIAYALDHSQEYYSSGTGASTVKCEGQRDKSCSAGNGMYSVTVGHLASFGVVMLTAGCGYLS
ncbi:Lipase, class 3 [Penicillium italicum]|uniref:Lipase, class 3 n=1 Tax=Penicillium italicum TaxID=40296 RepID=A0A0A2KRW3_PENIT|nr:Lipase, class 3 [Penicillium italicum]